MAARAAVRVVLGSQREGRVTREGPPEQGSGEVRQGWGRERGSTPTALQLAAVTTQDWPMRDPLQKQKPLLSWGQGLAVGVGPGYTQA